MLKGVSCPQPSPLFKVFFNSHLTKKSSNCLHLLFKDAEIFFFVTSLSAHMMMAHYLKCVYARMNENSEGINQPDGE